MSEATEKNVSQEANDHDDGSVWEFSRAKEVGGWTRCCDESEREELCETQILVTSEQPQDETEQEGGGTAVSVGLGQVEN